MQSVSLEKQRFVFVQPFQAPNWLYQPFLLNGDAEQRLRDL